MTVRLCHVVPCHTLPRKSTLSHLEKSPKPASEAARGEAVGEQGVVGQLCDSDTLPLGSLPGCHPASGYPLH